MAASGTRARAAADVLNAGVKLLCTAHGRDIDDLKRSPMLGELINKGIFERYAVLAAPGKTEGVYDGSGRLLNGGLICG